MIDMESRRGRHIIGRVETGRSLEDALKAVCLKYEVYACDVRVTGIVRDPILLTYREVDGEFSGAYRVPGLATLVSLTGDVSTLGSELILNAKAVIAWDDRGLPRVAAGQLKSASVHSVEYVLATFDDVVLERGFDPMTRLPVWTNISRRELPDAAEATPTPTRKGSAAGGRRRSAAADTPAPPAGVVEPSVEPSPVPAATPPPTRTVAATADDDAGSGPELRPAADERSVEVVRRPPRKGLWAEALTRSRALDDDDEDPELQPGDVLQHPRFGDCTVYNVDDDERVLVRRPGGGTAALARSHMKLSPSGTTDDGNSMYRIAVIRP